MHKNQRKRILRAFWLLFVCGGLLLSTAGPALAQKKPKKGKKKGDESETILPPNLAPADEQVINLLISDMLAAWQVGDVDKLHTYFAEDMSAVSGVWEPPVLGWANYSSNFKRQRARAQQVRLDRFNTLVRINGATAWACYQWEFFGVVDGQGSSARGQTTLVFVKRDGRWLIIHDHTSLTQDSLPQAPGAQPKAAAPSQGTAPPATPPSKPPSP